MSYKEFIPKQVCSQLITIDVNDETKTINEVKFHGGCPGNLAGISVLVKGRKISEVKNLLQNIPCREGMSSCPAQLAEALNKF